MFKQDYTEYADYIKKVKAAGEETLAKREAILNKLTAEEREILGFSSNSRKDHCAY
jgi:regulator of sigma D